MIKTSGTGHIKSKTEEDKNLSSDENNIKKSTVYSTLPQSFNDFTFSKRSHIKFFRKKKYDIEILGKKISLNDCSDLEYQNLLAYSFIKDNFKNGARILEINNSKTVISDHLKIDYEYWRLDNLNVLNEEFVSGKFSESVINCNQRGYFNRNFEDYFDFIFSISSAETLTNNKPISNKALQNLSFILKPGGFSIHNFSISFDDEAFIFKNIRSLFYNSSLFGIKQVNKFKSKKVVKTDEDILYLRSQNGKSKKTSADRKKVSIPGNVISYAILFKKEFLKLTHTAFSKPSYISEKYPVYIFHHIIKCGGQALSLSLRKWFKVYYDNLKDSNDINNFIKFKYNIHNLSGDTCISGHFNYDGIFPHQRYPEITFKRDKFRIFMFMRDPLQIRISLYYFLKGKSLKKQIPLDYSLETSLNVSDNMIAGMIPCDESNYKEVLDKYFFIGIVEHMQESMDKFALLTGKKKIEVKAENKSQRDSQVSELSSSVINKFKENNKLDYLIYEYCLERFHNS